MAGTRSLSPTEQAAVAAVLHTFPRRDQALVTLLANTGFRVSELLALTVEDVWSWGQVRDRVGLPRRRMKSGRSCWQRAVTGRSVPINQPVRAVLTAYLFSRFRGRGPGSLRVPLFPSRQGNEALSRWQATRIVHGVLRAAEVERQTVAGEFGCHTLRKVFCRLVYERTGHDIVLTSAAMGHRSVETTQGYLTVSQDQVDAAVLDVGQAGIREAARLSHARGTTA